MSQQERHICLCIADIGFSITIHQPINTVHVDTIYQDFLCTAEPEVRIHAHYDGVPQIPLRNEDTIFDPQAAWSLHRVDEQYVFLQKDVVPSATGPYVVAIFDRDFRHGTVHRRVRDSERVPPEGLLPYPLDYPLGEVLMICLLAQERGVMLHACGVDDAGRGYLFAGNSGDGKSTMARLWKDEATILNDDRIVLRQRHGRFWMYGTPWHGEYTTVSPHGIPVERIFSLHHAEANHARDWHGAAAASKLLARSFPPLWETDGMGFTLEFCTQLVKTVPCYELGFAPDRHIVDFVRSLR